MKAGIRQVRVGDVEPDLEAPPQIQLGVRFRAASRRTHHLRSRNARGSPYRVVAMDEARKCGVVMILLTPAPTMRSTECSASSRVREPSSTPGTR